MCLSKCVCAECTNYDLANQIEVAELKKRLTLLECQNEINKIIFNRDIFVKENKFREELELLLQNKDIYGFFDLLSKGFLDK